MEYYVPRVIQAKEPYFGIRPDWFKQENEILIMADPNTLFNALQKEVRNKINPPVSSIEAYFRLYAAAQAQRALSDADEYDLERAQQILKESGHYGLNITKTSKGVDISQEINDRKKGNSNGLHDLVIGKANAGKIDGLVNAFDQLNLQNGDKPLYVVETLFLFYGEGTGQNIWDDRIVVYVNDDPREDALPVISISPNVSYKVIIQACAHLGLDTKAVIDYVNPTRPNTARKR